MVVSRCHQASVSVYSANEGTSFYVCSSCENACDTIAYRDNYGMKDDDSRREAETEEPPHKS